MKIQTVPISTRGLAAAKNDSVGKEDKALKKACLEFESVLVNQMFKEMRKSVSKSDLFGSDQNEEMFQDMMDEEVSKDFSRTGSIGLGETIYRQFMQQNTAKVAAETVDR